MQDLLCAVRAVVGANRLAGCGVQRRHGCAETKGDIHAVPHRHQAPRQLRRHPLDLFPRHPTPACAAGAAAARRRPDTRHHDQVHHTVRKRQTLSVEPVNGHRSVDFLRANVCSRLLHVRGLTVQALHEIAVVSAQSRRQAAVATADMHHKPALDAGGREDLLSLRLRRRCGNETRRGQGYDRYGYSDLQ